MKFEEYLLQIAESACDASRRTELYNGWRKAQLRSNQKKRRAGKKRLELSFTLKQYEVFERDAEQLQISVTKLIQGVVDRGYKEQVCLLIAHDIAAEIQNHLREYATSLKQLSFHINTRPQNEVHREDMERLKTEFLKLQNAYLRFCTPVSLEAFFRNEYASNPQFLEHTQAILEAIKKEHNVHQTA